jgi:hypothetical protein
MGEDIERWFTRSKARACGEKQRYADEQEARHAAYFVRLHHGERLAPYLCPFCRQWHLGHSDGDRRRRG